MSLKPSIYMAENLRLQVYDELSNVSVTYINLCKFR